MRRINAYILHGSLLPAYGAHFSVPQTIELVVDPRLWYTTQPVESTMESPVRLVVQTKVPLHELVRTVSLQTKRGEGRAWHR